MAEVNLDFLEPNSNKYKQEKKEKEEFEPVIQKGSLAKPKKGFMQKFLQRDMKEVMLYYTKDILVPGIKDGLLEFVSLALTGQPLGRRKPNSWDRRDGNEKYSYNYCYNRKNEDRRDYRRNRPDIADEKIDYNNIILLERADAEIIVEKMQRRIEETGEASVADLFRLVNVESSYQDANWGWKNVSDIRVTHTRDGFLIDVREPKYLT